MVFERDSFKTAKGIWLKEYEGALNRTALYRTAISKGNNTIMNIAGQSTYQVYINGEFVDVINEENAAWSTVGYGSKFIFGGKMNYYNVSLSSPNMTVDNLRIYNSRVLSNSEIEQIYKFETQ